MSLRSRGWTWLLALLAAGEAAVIGGFLVRSHWQAEAAAAPVQRGRAVAERLGCFGCHGPGGAAGIPNPGARTGSVPTWAGGTWMMYNQDEKDVRGWILDGHPAGRKPDPGALIAMPAFRGRLSEKELGDLSAYVLTVSQLGNPEDEKAAAGRDVAVRLGCFGCHGPEGRGLTADPGSFKGYVPPWDGADYADLVRDGAELRQWVRNGVTDRFKANPAARRIVEGETIRMPAYGDRVQDSELDALAAYIDWVRKHPRR
jgi:mono/diheme cytochrome c family protein